MEPEILRLIKQRRSIRAFDPNHPVTDEQIQTILEAARWAPSAGNAQDWRFIVVRNSHTRQRLAEAARNQAFVAQAPVVLVVASNLTEITLNYGERGRTLYSAQDAAAAIQNILLTVHALGLGSCWVGAFDEKQAARVLSLPQDVRPLALLPIGVPRENPPPPARKTIKELVTFLD